MEMIPKPPLPEVPQEEIASHWAGWGLGMKILWIYSLLLISATILLNLFAPASPPVSVQQNQQEALVGAILFMPVVVFLVMVGLGRTRHRL